MSNHRMSTPERRAKRAGHDLRAWKASLLRLRTIVLGLTMRDFASRLGVHWQTVRSWEECGTFPTERLLDRLNDFASHEAGWCVDNWRDSHIGELFPHNGSGEEPPSQWQTLQMMWMQLVHMGAAAPGHDLHRALFLPLSEWLNSNRPEEAHE